MNNPKLAHKNAWYIFISLVFSFSIYILANTVVSAQTNTLNSTTTDAIAVRILANPAQYSIDEWYAKQNFSGSPQKIKVDGYDAIRDNRTVYVAATNIKGVCDGGGECSTSADCSAGACNLSKLYFNIYVITYNQGATARTSDIFGKILSNWKFNNNLNDQLGTCSFPLKNCQASSDCGNSANYDCTNSRCISKSRCLSDDDCQNSSLCNSPKASLLRDVKRLQNLNKINEALKAYKSVNNKYPILTAGTFLPQVVISTWPSWQNVFTYQLGISNLADPINKIGVCNSNVNATTTMAGFDGTTCWNGTDKRYYDGSNSSNLRLPANSYAMAYTTNNRGSNYDLCANMETGYTFVANNNPINLVNYNCRTTALGYSGNVNHAPTIVAMNLNGVAGQEFNGYIKADDADGNPMTFTILNDGTNWAGNGWSAKPVLKSTTDPKQKKLWAAVSGNATPSSYNISIQVTDSNGASITTTTAIKITAGAPIINASDAEYESSADANYNLNYNLYFSDANFSAFTLSLVAPSSFGTGLIGTFSNPTNIQSPMYTGFPLHVVNGLMGKVIKEAGGRYRLNIYGTIPAATPIVTDKDLVFNLRVSNSLGKSTDKKFTIKVKANPPQLDFSCNKKAGLYLDYNCQINNLNIKNKATVYSYSHVNLANQVSTSTLPTGFVGSTTAGVISGMPVNLGNYRFKIRATNEYGAFTEKEYDLAVESTCGTELVEYQGGPWNQTGEVKNQGGYYKTVLVNGQCWLADNLNFSQVYDSNQRHVSIKEESWWKKILISWFQPYIALAQVIDDAAFEFNLTHSSLGTCYNGDNTYCEAEGRLYQASEVMAGATASSVRGICPKGYHVPSVVEYDALVNGLGAATAGNKLKQNGDSGFEGYLAGMADKPTSTFIFDQRNTIGNFWTSSVQSGKNWYYMLSANNTAFGKILPSAADNKYYSLRCIQDTLCPANCATCDTTGHCCLASSWSPVASSKCGNVIQTSNCGTTQNVVGGITCTAPNICDSSNQCSCTPNCTNRVCGDNGCGGTCGSCTTTNPNGSSNNSRTCVGGQCVLLPGGGTIETTETPASGVLIPATGGLSN